MNGAVVMGGYGVFPTNDNKSGYYILNFKLVPYTLQEDFDVDGQII